MLNSASPPLKGLTAEKNDSKDFTPWLANFISNSGGFP